MSLPTETDAATPAGPKGECGSDGDCVELLGKPGSKCVDALCWPPSAPEECSVDMDCASRGPEFVGGKCVASLCRANPRWRCERPETVPQTEKITLKILVRSSLSLAPLPDIHVLVCDKLDLSCVAPVGEVTTDRDGMILADVPGNFAGYLQLDNRSYVPALYFLPPAIPKDGMLQPAPLMPNGVVDALASSIGSRIDSSRGQMMLIAEDCYGEALPGVTFESPAKDDKTIQFYVRDLLPTTSAMETAEIGNGGYLNFPPGNAVINLDMQKTKLHLTTASVVVRPGFITVAYLRPELR